MDQGKKLAQLLPRSHMINTETKCLFLWYLVGCVLFYFGFCYCLFVCFCLLRQSHIAQVSLELTMQVRVTLNYGFFCLYVPKCWDHKCACTSMPK